MNKGDKNEWKTFSNEKIQHKDTLSAQLINMFKVTSKTTPEAWEWDLTQSILTFTGKSRQELPYNSEKEK